MNVRLQVLASTAFALTAVVPAWADGPWYVSGSIGGYFRESNSFSTSFFHSNDPSFRVPGSNRLSYNPDVIGNVALGYVVMPHIRLEAEIGYTDYTGDTLNPLAHSALFPRLNGSTYSRLYGDDYARWMGSVNAFYDFSPIAGFTPYVGAGLGGSANNKSFGQFVGPVPTRSNALGASIGAGSGGPVILKPPPSFGGPFAARFNSRGGSAAEGLVLVEAGTSYPLTDDLAVTASYRYIHFFDSGEDIAHIVKMGLRYSF